MPIILLAVIILLALMVAASCVRIVPQAHAMIIERLGMFKRTGSGFCTTAGYHKG